MRNLLKKSAIFASTLVATSVALVSTVSAQGYTYSYDYGTTAAAGTLFAGGFTVIWCCVACIPLIILIALAIWVYKDAEKYKVDNAILWAILTFVTGIIGLLIYLLAVRPDAKAKVEGGSSKSAS